MNKKIYIGSDHAGYELKTGIIHFLKSLNHEVVDCGPYDAASVDYPDFAFKVANEVSNSLEPTLGVLICGTGFGMCIAANKVKGIRAVVVHNSTTAPLAVEHNNANVICLSARFNDVETNEQILKAFLQEKFGGDRHQRRLDKISDYEKNH